MKRSNEQDMVRRALAMAASGKIAEAFIALRDAAAAGSALAAATVAEWRMAGDLVRRDLADARDYYGRAAKLGMEAAAPVYIALLANGAGNLGRDWPAAMGLLRERAGRDASSKRQLALIDAMTLDEVGSPISPPTPTTVSVDPEVLRVASFLSPAECRYLIERARPQLQPSLVVHPTTGRMVMDPVRKASSMSFGFVIEDPVIHAIGRRIMATVQIPVENGESIQVLQYRPGQEYKIHSDALPPGGSQRTWTFLVWLNDGFGGGETIFPEAGLTVKGQIGEAIFFRNTDSAGRPLARARHAGSPVTSGTKLLLSRWIRDRPLDLSGPPGRAF
jgi:prolyl 4-hydroxylase